MIEVVSVGNRWRWTLIGFCGRVLAYPVETFDSYLDASEAGKAWRRDFWARACLVDNRMGACR